MRPHRSLPVALLLVFALFVVAGCGGGSSDGSSDATTDVAAGNEKAEGTLSFWYVPTDPSVGEWWDGFVADFEAENPGVTVEVTRNSVDNFQAKTLSAFASGDQPDIIAMDTGEYLQKFVRGGFIGDISDLADFSYYNPAAVEVLTAPGGEIWGVPEYSFVITMWRNAGLFEKYGVDVPKDWDELLTACKTFSDAGVIPIAFGDGGQDQWTAGHFFSTLLYQYAGVGKDVAATYGDEGASWSDPEFVEAATRLRELADSGCFPEGFTGLNYTQMSALFQRSEAAMIFTGSWFGAEVAGAKDVKVDVIPAPDGTDAAHSTANLEGVIAGVSAIVASSDAVENNPALVKAFLDAFGAAADDYANENNLLSVAASPKPSGGPVQAAQTEQLRSADELVTVTDVAVPAGILDEYYENLQAMLAGEKSPEEFGEAMAEAAERERSTLPAREGGG
jgi:raffinose/stachyose/melibiose transport system substrate-binding protein